MTLLYSSRPSSLLLADLHTESPHRSPLSSPSSPSSPCPRQQAPVPQNTSTSGTRVQLSEEDRVEVEDCAHALMVDGKHGWQWHMLPSSGGAMRSHHPCMGPHACRLRAGQAGAESSGERRGAGPHQVRDAVPVEPAWARAPHEQPVWPEWWRRLTPCFLTRVSERAVRAEFDLAPGVIGQVRTDIARAGSIPCVLMVRVQPYASP